MNATLAPADRHPDGALVDTVLACMRKSGATVQQIDDARLQLIRGAVLANGQRATEPFDPEFARGIQALDEAAVTAAAERAAQDNEVKHLRWCVPGGCQTDPGDDGRPFTTHDGARNELPNRGRHARRIEPLLHSSLYYEDGLTGGPNLCVTFYDEGVPYSAAEADELIKDFEAFLTELKAQRAQLDGKPVGA